MRRSLFAVLVWSLVASSLNAQAVDKSLVIEEFDIPTDGDVMTVPVKASDKEYRFMLDTGCDVTLFDTALKPLLGPPLEKRSFKTPLDSGETEVFMFPKIQMGRMPIAVNGRVACMQLGDFRKVAGQEIFGWLGMDVLSQYVVRLDFDRGKLTFLRGVGREEGVRIPLLHRRVPIVHLRLQGMRPLQFMIDTGDVGMASGALNSSLIPWMQHPTRHRAMVKYPLTSLRNR